MRILRHRRRLANRLLAACIAVSISAVGASADAKPSRLILWAWERPEDLRFVVPPDEIAWHAAYMVLHDGHLETRRRRSPLLIGHGNVTTAVVHIQVAHGSHLVWSPGLCRQTVNAALAYGLARHPSRLQIDFEVGASERRALLDVLRDLAARKPNDVSLSMTAIVSWCESEHWLEEAQVDEIVPMLFRMGRGGEAIRRRLESGRDFVDPRCRIALAISTDSPIARAPTGRRVYVFDPRSWTPAAYVAVRREVGGWTPRASSER